MISTQYSKLDKIKISRKQNQALTMANNSRRNSDVNLCLEDQQKQQ